MGGNPWFGLRWGAATAHGRRPRHSPKTGSTLPLPPSYKLRRTGCHLQGAGRRLPCSWTPWAGVRFCQWRLHSFFYGRILTDMRGCSRIFPGWILSRLWALGRGLWAKMGRCVNRQERMPAQRGEGSGFVPANCSMFRLMPWGKGATPREPTVEKPCKQRGMVNVAPDIVGAKSGCPRIVRIARINPPLPLPHSCHS